MRWINDFLRVLIMTFRLGPSRVLSLSEEAITDELTGLLTRRALREMGEREIARASRFKKPLSCLFIDLDFFKLINDNLGYQVGDKVLKMFSAVLEEGCRKEDECFRWGGDEFVILLPETREEDAKEIIKRLQKKVYSLELEIREDVKVSFSWGLSEWRKGLQLDDLLFEAGQEMKKMKK